ncbi:MAG: Fe-S protein assembly co-chaperone HscB [Magnetococcales bacterium]|nr:Fe-S protein assembly co-chaperone HscB [Magnetococcales bacterium]
MTHLRSCWSCGATVALEPFCPGCRAIQPPDPGADYFALLEVPRSFQVERSRAEQIYREKQQQLHPDRFALRSAQERRYSLEQVTQLNDAWRTLRDPLQRGEYLLQTLGGSPSPDPAKRGDNMAGDPEFLMEVMEMREELATIDPASDPGGQRLAKLRLDVEQRIKAEITTLDAVFATALAAAPAPSAWATAGQHLNRLRYHLRFMEEVDRLEEQAI